ncbi:DegT/DnrJ/EryC1/StrS family aminotransferase [Pseudarthrobacter sp. C1]|uniref:DegT/DnrJ/EryC1/StrS family aminotransferase n=1 Tax=Pseudarthrobacter sp. C1 TaxID=3108940 RepID=UPI002B05C0FE|nr:DegT/DnrJ/EryC1/StrS family aminotransferase [Pseudarthrobacter sp. C1]MEA3550231.1 DegT/DnrJ/EryC1/StrS family aminotransferase [Pseudarthrobacter sp. C1]
MSRPSISELERKYLLDAFDSGWISSLGDYVVRAEDKLKTIGGVTHAAVVSNGTTALHLALLALDIGPGDEVIIPSSTYVATLNAVLYVGALPVIVDVDPVTWCISPDAVHEALTTKTRAVIAVDLYGHPADYGSLREICGPAGVVLVADAAESIGGSLQGVPVGALADVSTFSFFGNKVVTSGEGGAVVTQDAEVDRRIRKLRNQGNHEDRRYFHDILGYNYRMTNLAAAILCAQLERLPELLSSRQGVVEQYDRLFELNPTLVPQGRASGAAASPWMYSLELKGELAGRRDDIMSQMRAEGVETRPVFNTVESMPYLKSFRSSPTPVAGTLAKSGVSLPTFPGMTPSEVEHVVTSLFRACGLTK